MSPASSHHPARDPDAKKRRILEAARRLLVQRGFQDIVLDDVARAAGVAKGTLFLHYKSKEELFAAAFADLVDGLGLALDALARAGGAGRGLLVATARVILSHFDRNRDFMGQFNAGRLPGCSARSCEKLLEKFRANQRRVAALVAAASADEGRSIRDPEYAAVAFIGLCRSAAVRKMVHRREGGLERDAELVASFFVSGSGVTL